MSAWDYDRIRHALDTLEEAKRDLPAVKQQASSYENPWIVNPDEGPQFVMEDS